MLPEETKTEREILDRAIEVVGHEAGLRLKIECYELQIEGRQVDAILRLEAGKNQFAVEIKKWAQHTNFGALINQMRELPYVPLLVADYINPNMAERLQHEEIQFIDTAGNAYINQPPVYVFVAGKRKEERKDAFMPTRTGANRAFEPKGLMVVYAFLCKPDLVNAPYREIAETTGVAVGTVGWVLNGLKAGNFIGGKANETKRYLINYKGLLNRWIEAYPEKLKPKMAIGTFTTTEDNWWRETKIKKYGGYWGGEVAGAIYTNYLTPKKVTVYLPKDKLNEFLRDIRLRKVTNWLTEPGNPVEIVQPFWPETNDFVVNATEELVHPVLTYADLVASGDARNMEVARKIYDERLAKYNREG